MVLLVGEVGPNMTGGAVAFFGEENLPAPLGRLAHRVSLYAGLCGSVKLGKFWVIFEIFRLKVLKGTPLLVVVVGGGCRDNHAFKGSDGLANRVNGDATKYLLELLGVDGNARQSLHNPLMREAHFDRVGNRPHGLGFQRVDAAIPELLAGENAIVGHR